MPFDWSKIGTFTKAVIASPLGQSAVRAVLNELEQNPDYVRFVSKYQKLRASECMICAFHKYGRERRLNLAPNPPPHECADLDQ